MRCFALSVPACLLVGLLVFQPASACHLPATLPILPGSSHSHEMHFVTRDNYNYAHQRFDEATFGSACFRGINLTGTSMRNVWARSSSFDDVILIEADFTGAILHRSNLNRVIAHRAVFDYANLSDASITAPVGQTTFAASSFNGANLSNATLRRINFVDSSFVGAQFSGADVSGSDFSGAELRNADLSTDGENESFDALLAGADLRGANLTGMTFWQPMTGANLVGAVLDGTMLYGDLRGAILDGQYVSERILGRATDLRGASFRNATLSLNEFRHLEGADLRSADLSQSSDAITYDRFTVYDVATQLPAGFDPTSAPLTLYGDNNDDSVVDIEDLNNVRNNFGATGPIGMSGDTVFDGMVDVEDLNAVRNAFGSRAMAPIPESPSGLLLGLSLVLCAMHMGCRRGAS